MAIFFSAALAFLISQFFYTRCQCVPCTYRSSGSRNESIRTVYVTLSQWLLYLLVSPDRGSTFSEPDSNQKGYDAPTDRERNRRLPMSGRNSLSLVELFYAAPVKSALLSIGPIALAVGQVLNGYLNGVSPVVSITFAVVMVAFAVVATRHHAAEHRLRRLEADLEDDGLEAGVESRP